MMEKKKQQKMKRYMDMTKSAQKRRTINGKRKKTSMTKSTRMTKRRNKAPKGKRVTMHMTIKNTT